MDDLAKSLDEESIRLTVDGILPAIKETVVAFGISIDDLEQCRQKEKLRCLRRNGPNYHTLLQKENRREKPKRGFIIASMEKILQDKEKNAFKSHVILWKRAALDSTKAPTGQLFLVPPSSLIGEQNIGLKTQPFNESGSLSMSLDST